MSKPHLVSKIFYYIIGFVIKVLLPLFIILFGAYFGYLKFITGPKADKKVPSARAVLVETKQFKKGDQQIYINIMGSVIPAKEILLQSQVNGKITNIHKEFQIGGFVDEGLTLLQIDSEDYELALVRQQGELAAAEMALQVEQAQQGIAKWDYEQLNEKQKQTVDKEMMLRKPHLKKAIAAVESAKAAMEKTRLDIERTNIVVPFDALIMQKNVDIGSHVSQQTQLAQLIGTEEFWIKASVPIDRLKWIDIPAQKNAYGEIDEEGSRAIITYSKGLDLTSKYDAKVSRLLGQLENRGHMANIILTVEDPLRLKSGNYETTTPLLIGSYVNVQIEGQTMKDVFAIPRYVLHDNNTIWIMSKNNTLLIKKVQIAYKDQNKVFVTNDIHDTDNIIISNISTPIEGMLLQTSEQLQQKSKDTNKRDIP